MKEQRLHYVNNKDFSTAVVEYVKKVQQAKKEKNQIPIVPDYIARCFLDIAEGLSHKANFVRYTYKEEMVMDAVENCLKAIENYNIETATRTGKPNAFAYFTQISWYAFLRRIQKEKKQQDIKLKYLSESGLEEIIYDELDHDEAVRQTQAFVDELRSRIDFVKSNDKVVDEYVKKERKKRTKIVDSDLTSFMV